jgi:predicted RNase H-like nuclease
MFVVGMDGCRGGWLEVKLGRHGHPESRIFADMSSPWAAYPHATLILVDMSIWIE